MEMEKEEIKYVMLIEYYKKIFNKEYLIVMLRFKGKG
jgi:hypothetical protein